MVRPDGLVANIVTGVSGAGRPPKATTTFCAVDENVTGYGLLTHRHTPEIEQALKQATGTQASVLFTPHLAPMNRGILATCYGRPAMRGATTDDVMAALSGYYRNEPFVRVDHTSPQTKAVVGSNAVHLTGRADPRTGMILVIAALDNLVKGAAGMAIQCANLALGLEESSGLTTIGLYP